MIVAPPPPAALAVSPVRVELAGAGAATIRLANTGGGATVVDGARAGFAIDVTGRPRVAVLRDRGVQVLVRPQRVVLAPGGAAAATILVRLRRGASPGDHTSLVVFATRPRSSGGVGVRLRVGVVVVVRVPGAVVHRLRLARVSVARHGRRATLIVRVRNRGNVLERIGRSALRVLLRGRPVRALGPAEREVLPGGTAAVRFACPVRHGRLVVVLQPPTGPGVRHVVGV